MKQLKKEKIIARVTKHKAEKVDGYFFLRAEESVLLYRKETWTLRKEERKRLQVLETWPWRSMERISWRDRVTNE